MPGIRHKFVSDKSDPVDQSLIKPSNWNDGHLVDIVGLIKGTESGDIQSAVPGVDYVNPGNSTNLLDLHIVGDITTEPGSKMSISISGSADKLANKPVTDFALITDIDDLRGVYEPLGTATSTMTAHTTAHNHALLHSRQHAVTSGSDHTFPGGGNLFLRADGTWSEIIGMSGVVDGGTASDETFGLTIDGGIA